jgi:hypothetical protein
MKTVLQELGRGSILNSLKKMLLGRAEKNGRGAFKPAPSYWALVPIKPDRMPVSKKNHPVQ